MSRLDRRIAVVLCVVACCAAGAMVWQAVTNHRRTRGPSAPQVDERSSGDVSAGVQPPPADARKRTSVGRPALQKDPGVSAPSARLPLTVAPLMIDQPAKKSRIPKRGKGVPNSPAAPDNPPAPEPPMAREALSLVGVDEVAQAVWLDSINDLSVPEDARRNLIEDLNEDGFDDPKHVTPDDIPLIVSRLQLIEQLAPQAVDDINSAAFQEAYKDLAEMLEKASAQ